MGLTSRARWVGPPAHWQGGRKAGGRPTPAYVVIHVTDGSEGPNAAEAGAVYDKVRTDSVSTHLFVDSDSAVREVRDIDTAYAAFPKGNALGIQVEICGLAAQTVAQWHDAASTATLKLAAFEVAVLCQDHGLPVRHLTIAECRAAWYAPGPGTRGIVSHYDVTRAYPEDGGSHTDPGPNFPWVEFLVMVREYLAAGSGDSEMAVSIENAVTDCLVILTALASGADTAAVHDRDGQLDLRPFWARVGREAAQASTGQHTHPVSISVSGSGSGTTGEAVPTP
jgi:hypothetical protein